MMSVQVGDSICCRVDGISGSVYRFHVGTTRSKQAKRGRQAKAEKPGRIAASYVDRPPDERILSLLMLLLDAQGPVSRAEIFQRIPAYRTTNPVAGERKFERDKDELRALGVPLIQEQEKV
jgi:hypothetical protein